MKNCIFCIIADKPEQESHRVIYIDGAYMAMLVSHPVRRGHFVVFPRKHYSQISEYPDEDKLVSIAINLAENLVPKLGTNAYTLRQNNNIYTFDDNPLHVGHIHMHVTPWYIDSKSTKKNPKRASRKSLKETMTVMLSERFSG